MKITILIEAKYIENGTLVRKPTGEKIYKLTREITIFNEKTERKGIFCDEGTVFLSYADGINVILEERKLAIDFDSIDEATVFLQDLDRKEERDN